MSIAETCEAEYPSGKGCSTTSERDINVGVHLVNDGPPESIAHDCVNCFCEEKRLNSSIHRNESRTSSNKTVPYENNTDAEALSGIITISAGGTTSSRFHGEHSPDQSRRCGCRVLSLNIHIWLDRVPDPTNTDEIHPPSDWYKIIAEMTPEERKMIQDLVLAPPGRVRFYTNPVVQAAMFPPELALAPAPASAPTTSAPGPRPAPAPAPPPPSLPLSPLREEAETPEEHESGSKKNSNESKESSVSKETKEKRVGFMKKLLGLGIQAMRYLGERESAKRKGKKGRKLLSKKRPETNPYYLP